MKDLIQYSLPMYYDQYLDCACGCEKLINAQDALWDGDKAYFSKEHMSADLDVLERTQDNFIYEPSARNYDFEDRMIGWEL